MRMWHHMQGFLWFNNLHHYHYRLGDQGTSKVIVTTSVQQRGTTHSQQIIYSAWL